MRYFLARLGTGVWYGALEAVCRVADRFESRPDRDDPLPGQVVGSGYRARRARRDEADES